VWTSVESLLQIKCDDYDVAEMTLTKFDMGLGNLVLYKNMVVA